MALRVCRRCGAILPLDKFYHDKRSAGGRRWICKSCCLTRHAELYALRESRKKAEKSREQ